MQSTDIQNTKATAPQDRFRLPRKLTVATGVLVALVALAVLWSVTRTNERRVFSLQTLPSDNSPAFIATSKPSRDLGPLTNLPLHKKLMGIYLKLKMQVVSPKPNPAAYSFPPRADRICSVNGFLSQCAQVTGTRYLIAREARGDAIDFGHSKTLNGAQWVAAFEQALQRNGYELIRETPGGRQSHPERRHPPIRKSRPHKTAQVSPINLVATDVTSTATV